jgi:predicted small metal-binding protein
MLDRQPLPIVRLLSFRCQTRCAKAKAGCITPPKNRISSSRSDRLRLANPPHPALLSPENDQKEEIMAMSKQPERPETGTSGSKGNYSFRCADVGFTGCTWQTQGASTEEVLRNAEQHGRERHNLASFDEKTRNMVRSKIRQAA